MTLLQLLYFDTLARVLHYTRAAQELHISQPSLPTPSMNWKRNWTFSFLSGKSVILP